MFVLPAGVTGFAHRVRKPEWPWTDANAFRERCRAAARALRRKFLGFDEPYSRTTNSFAVATLDAPAGPVAVLLNAHFPIVSFAVAPAVDALEQRFVDAPELLEHFRALGAYEVLDRSEVEAPITDAAVALLSKGERGQLKYWMRNSSNFRVGDVIFNNWD